jgi:hypothetical protein
VDLVIFKPASLEAIQEGLSQIVHSVNHIGRTGKDSAATRTSECRSVRGRPRRRAGWR